MHSSQNVNRVLKLRAKSKNLEKAAAYSDTFERMMTTLRYGQTSVV